MMILHLASVCNISNRTALSINMLPITQKVKKNNDYLLKIHDFNKSVLVIDAYLCFIGIFIDLYNVACNEPSDIVRLHFLHCLDSLCSHATYLCQHAS